MKKFFIVGIILIGLAVFAWLYFTGEKKDPNILTLYGNVDIREVNLSFRIGGRIVKMPFEEGDQVKAGQVLALLDKNQFEDNVNESKAETIFKQAQLDELLAGTRPEQIAQAKANVRERESTLANAEKLLEKNKLGYEAKVVSLQEYQNTQTQVKEGKARLSSTKEVLQEAINGPRKETVQAAKANLEAAKANLSLSTKNIYYTKLISPSNGVILTRVQEPGAVVSATQTVYALSLNEPKWIQAYIDEVDLGKIYPGMCAEIKTDSYSDKVYKGQIGFISPVAEFTPKSVETKELRTDLVYRLRVIVKDHENELRQGMPVTVNLYLNNGKQNEKASGKN